jgi:hypothetical protein
METAASGQTGSARGASRLLKDCAALGRLTETNLGTARARLELELGGELAGMLCRALAQRRPSRSGLFLV